MLKMNKKTVFLGTATDVEREAFHDYYMEQVAPVIAAHPSVNQYYANKIVVPSQELIDAGWGWGGYDDSGIFAMDEIWCAEGFDVLSLYENLPEVKIIGAYDTDEVVCRPTLLGSSASVCASAMMPCGPSTSSTTGNMSTHLWHCTPTLALPPIFSSTSSTPWYLTR